MTKADRYMYNMINQIMTEGYTDINPRPKYADGTPAHTISVNHTYRTYNLSKGEFPICTLRPQAWKTGIKEIFTIHQKPTNNLEEMREMGVGWWDEWDIGDGTGWKYILGEIVYVLQCKRRQIKYLRYTDRLYQIRYR